MKSPLSPLLLIAALLLGGWLSYRIFTKPEKQVVESSTVLLEKIEAVTKLITVEGHFSEIYNYSENQEGWTSYFYGKKVLVRVQATVSAGYDLNSLKFDADERTKTITMSAWPEPKILSIDHKLDYYDISEGYFVDLTPEDYTRINDRAKELIRENALKSDLLTQAETQANSVRDIIRFMVESTGWKLVEAGKPGFSQ
jgi:hypothetical protein